MSATVDLKVSRAVFSLKLGPLLQVLLNHWFHSLMIQSLERIIKIKA